MPMGFADSLEDGRRAMFEFVRALARRQARIDNAARVHFAEINHYIVNPSPKNRKGVKAHVTLALELFLRGSNST